MLLLRFLKHYTDRTQTIGIGVVLLTTHLAGCATPGVRKAMKTCLTDPGNVALQCTLEDGTQKTEAFPTAYDYACFPMDQLAEYLRGCR